MFNCSPTEATEIFQKVEFVLRSKKELQIHTKINKHLNFLRKSVVEATDTIFSLKNFHLFFSQPRRIVICDL